MIALILLIIVMIFFMYFIVICLQKIKKKATKLEVSFGTLYIFSLILFAFGMIAHSNPYYKAIDPVDVECYSPFGESDIVTLFFYFLTFNSSLLLIWLKNKVLAPLTLTLCLIFILIGIFINLVILYQISSHDISTIDIYSQEGDYGPILFFFAPFLSILISILLCYEVMNQQITDNLDKTYSNKYLNSLNVFLTTKSRTPIWIFILMFPVCIGTTLILILLGQDSNSIVKVFTETATWKLSQQIHPPIMDHKGHYLCTVAACGNPTIVKPLRLGQRNGRPIIVNRQLLIANAFEEMIQDFSPKLHHFIRTNYDKYGYNISKKINSSFLSNVTYILMKPIEWIFLISLYLICKNPEEKINKQYSNKNPYSTTTNES